MPQVSVSNTGGAPVLAAHTSRTTLILQNNTAKEIRYRLFGPVSLVTGSQSGLTLKPGGGFVALSGVDAQRPIYAVTVDGSTVTLDYESNITA